MERWPRLRRLLLALAAASVLLAGLALWQPARVAVQAARLLVAVFPSTPFDPLLTLGAPPYRTQEQLAAPVGLVAVDVYHPGERGRRYGGVVLQYQGPRPVPPRDPALVRFAESFARLGVVVLVPSSPSLLAGRVEPGEVEAVRLAFARLLAQPDVDPGRAGYVGFSVGGSFSLIAATSTELRDRVRFVATLGAYADASSLLVDTASRSIEVDGRVEPWEPSAITRSAVGQQLVEALPAPAERERLRPLYLEPGQAGEAADGAGLSPEGEVVRALLLGTRCAPGATCPGPASELRAARARAERLVARLPAGARARLAAISPVTVLAGLRAHLYLLHDRGDRYVPYTEARRLAAAAPAGTLRRYTELSLFSHVQPDETRPWYALLPGAWALFWHLHAVLLELL